MKIPVLISLCLLSSVSLCVGMRGPHVHRVMAQQRYQKRLALQNGQEYLEPCSPTAHAQDSAHYYMHRVPSRDCLDGVVASGGLWACLGCFLSFFCV